MPSSSLIQVAKKNCYFYINPSLKNSVAKCKQGKKLQAASDYF
jgi:hypothetical protein